jgi:hypothetical protein
MGGPRAKQRRGSWEESFLFFRVFLREVEVEKKKRKEAGGALKQLLSSSHLRNLARSTPPSQQVPPMPAFHS